MSAVEESVLRISIDHLLEGVQVIGFDWRYLYLNTTAAEHGQRPANELLGQTMMAAFPGIEHTELFGVLRRVMDTRRPETLLNEFTYPTGDRRWFRLLVDPVPAGICVLSLEVTESRRAEQQLQQAQKLEAIGQLAGGVAHDFNNMLTAILGYAELITEQIGPDKPIGRDLQEIVAAAERASALTRQLLAFSRSEDVTPESLSLHDVIAGLEPMLRRLIPENLAIHVSEGATHETICASATQIEQVLINLIVNARDAMLAGGTIAISTRNLDPVPAEQSTESSPGWVVLSVRDTGVGMTPEVRARIFEPFFTTKGPGHGTGLGLVAVQDIVKKLGGQVLVESAPGRGTTFEVCLPTTAEAARRPDAQVRTASAVGRETILLVEDEPGVRSYAATVLKRHGYRVVEAISGEEALELDRQSTDVHLLLTDLVLPGMDGAQLARTLQQVRPDARSLLMTGYTHPASASLPDGTGILAKPFTARELLSRVRRALDSPR